MRDSVTEQMTDQRRALLTEREREILAGEADVTENYRYSVESRVRTRLRDRLKNDVDILRTNYPEIFDDLIYPVVCQPDSEESDQWGGGETDETASPDTADRPAVDRARLLDELPGSGELAERRADEILKMWDHLREHGTAEKSDFLGVVDVEATGYDGSESVWSNMVKGRDTLRALPGVETPATGKTKWRYTGE